MSEERVAMSVVTSIHDAIYAHCDESIESIANAVFTAIDAAGWAVVPKRADDRIREALDRALCSGDTHSANPCGDAWHDALAAAPKPE